MGQSDTLEQIVSLLYDAMLDDRKWVSAAAMIERTCKSKGVILAVADDSARLEGILFSDVCYEGQRRPDLEQAYLRDFHPIDEHMPRFRLLEDSRITRATQLFTEQELKTSATYNEWLARIHGKNGLRVRLDGPANSRIFGNIGDPAGNRGWSTWQTDLIAELLPHVRQFVRVLHALAGVRGRNRPLEKLLEDNRTATVEVDRHGRIRNTNDAGLRLLKTRALTTDHDGHLKAGPGSDAARLDALLSGAAPAHGKTPRSGSMTLRDLDRTIRGVLHTIPTDERSVRFRSPDVAAVIVVIENSARGNLTARDLEAKFRLTRTEAEIASGLAAGKSLRQIASETSRKEGTVAWHKKQIFTKLGIHRQTDIVRLVLGTPDKTVSSLAVERGEDAPRV